MVLIIHLSLSLITFMYLTRVVICLKCVSKDTSVICSPGKSDIQLRRGIISDNNNATSITLRGCKISSVALEAFQNLTSLNYLDLSQNKIQILRPGVFDGNKHVRHLNLSHNLLTSLDLGLFDHKSNLEVLDLKDNNLKNLELGVFDALRKLKYLDLTSNKILGKDLNPYLFDKNQNIEFMDFSRMDMSGSNENLLHAFVSLKFLKLDRCSLDDVPSFMMKDNLRSLNHLILSTNQIKNLENPLTFVRLDELRILDLTANHIEAINENVFSVLKNLQKIILRFNRLVSIPDKLFQNVPKLNSIDLSHNLIQYVPVNAFRGTKMKNLNLSDNRFTYLESNFYLELKNSGARLLKFFFNDNPWQCACLLELINELKPHRVIYNTDKFKGETPVCVTQEEFNCKRHHEFNVQFNEMFYDDIKKT